MGVGENDFPNLCPAFLVNSSGVFTDATGYKQLINMVFDKAEGSLTPAHRSAGFLFITMLVNDYCAEAAVPLSPEQAVHCNMHFKGQRPAHTF